MDQPTLAAHSRGHSGRNGVQRTGKNRSANGNGVVLFILFAFAIALREPDLWLAPRFWEEEGWVYFRDAWHSTAWSSLFKVYAGYLDLSANIPAAIAAKLVTLENAPLVTTAFAFVFQLMPYWVIAQSQSSFWAPPYKKVLGMLLILTVPMTSEIWLNTTTSKFHLALASSLLLLEDSVLISGVNNFMRIGILAFASLSSPITTFLTPFFLRKAWLERNFVATTFATILLLATAIHGSLLMFATRSEALSRAGNLNLWMLLPAMANRELLTSILGQAVTFKLAQFSTPLLSSTQHVWAHLAINSVAIAVFALLGFLVHRTRNSFASVLFAGGFWVGLISVASSVPEGRDQMLFPLNIRYHFTPCVLLLLSALTVAFHSNSRREGTICRIAVTLALLNGLWSFKTFHWKHPDWHNWKQDVAKWRVDPTVPMSAWPNRSFYISPNHKLGEQRFRQ